MTDNIVNFPGAVMGCHCSKAGADGAATDGTRIACVKFTIDCEEGEGLL
jgi:hypothetical protein